jgi:hypothetical protein
LTVNLGKKLKCLIKTKIKATALAAWRSGHRISLRNKRSEFESRQDVSFLGKT